MKRRVSYSGRVVVLKKNDSLQVFFFLSLWYKAISQDLSGRINMNQGLNYQRQNDWIYKQMYQIGHETSEALSQSGKKDWYKGFAR